MNHASWSPTGTICCKCGKEIMNNQGRRFRMKWFHEHCLPDTRKAHLTKRREGEDGGLPEPPKGLSDEDIVALKKKMQELRVRVK